MNTGKILELKKKQLFNSYIIYILCMDSIGGNSISCHFVPVSYFRLKIGGGSRILFNDHQTTTITKFQTMKLRNFDPWGPKCSSMPKLFGYREINKNATTTKENCPIVQTNSTLVQKNMSVCFDLSNLCVLNSFTLVRK